MLIFPAIAPPQYIGVRPTDGEMKDIIWYRNRHLTKKTSIQYAIFKKCGCYVTAIYLNIWHQLNFYDIYFKSNIFSKLRYWQDTFTLPSPCNRLFNYYNVVLFCKFLTMTTTSCRYIDKLLTNYLLLPGSATLNILSLDYWSHSESHSDLSLIRNSPTELFLTF